MLVNNAVLTRVCMQFQTCLAVARCSCVQHNPPQLGVEAVLHCPQPVSASPHHCLAGACLGSGAAPGSALSEPAG